MISYRVESLVLPCYQAQCRRFCGNPVTGRQNDKSIVERNMRATSARNGQRFFIFLSSVFLSFLDRNAHTGDFVAVEEMVSCELCSG